MDTTPKYIKLCEEAQKDINKEPELWDYFYNKKSNQIEIITSFNRDHLLGYHWSKGEIPLYRQDQLQEMGQYKVDIHDGIYFLMSSFWYFLNPMEAGKDEWVEEEKYIQQFNSLEQLWLAFVMSERYLKHWSADNLIWRKKNG